MLFFVKTGNYKPWIVDSGASDHMTGDKSLFHHYNPCYDGLSVKIADGTLSKVAGTGSVTLSEDIELKSVLHVPNLDCNLLSVSKLTVLLKLFLICVNFRLWIRGGRLAVLGFAQGSTFFIQIKLLQDKLTMQCVLSQPPSQIRIMLSCYGTIV